MNTPNKKPSELRPPYTPVNYKRNCNSREGSTHWQGCDCHEENWQKQLDEQKEKIAELEKFNQELIDGIYATKTIISLEEKLKIAMEALTRINKKKDK